ncbi:MAG: oligosaccharide flippase family protein [Candidatus ainarchaeum sp.]|nr:oligosaccharide flippase family protein [Candidatus ainarchaeum sp.]
MSSIERGTFLLFVSNIVFFACSFLLYLILGRFLLSPEQFGVFAVVISLVSIITTSMTVGIQQAVSKFIAANEEDAFLIRKKMLFFQFCLGIVLFAIYFTLADFMGFVLKDAGIVPFLRLSSLVLLFHPMLCVINGVFNGLKKFPRLAFFGIFYNAFKLAAMILLVLAGFAVAGAVLGFVLASLVTVLFGFFFSAVKKSKSGLDIRPLLFFALPLVSSAFLLNLFQSLGLFAVKALSVSSINVDVLAGNFSISVTVASVPAALLLSVSTVVLPLVAGALQKNDLKKTRVYIKESVRYSLLFLGFSTAILAASSKQLIELIFSEKYSFAAEPMVLLSLAFVFFALFQLLSAIIAAADRSRLPLLFIAISVALCWILNIFLVPLLSLQGAALSALFSMLVGFLLSAAFVAKKFGSLISIKAFFRIILASAIVFLVLFLFPVSGLILIPFYAGLLGLYAIILFISRELSQKDFAVFGNMVK